MFNTILYIKLMNVYSHLNKWYKGLEIFKTLCNFHLKKLKQKIYTSICITYTYFSMNFCYNT